MQGSFNSTGLVVSSKLPRFSDFYTLSIASVDPKSKAAKEPVEFTKSVTQWSRSLSFSTIFIHTPPPPTHVLPIINIAQVILCATRFYLFTFSWKQFCRFTKDGILVEGLLWKDVEGLINDYAREPKKNK